MAKRPLGLGKSREKKNKKQKSFSKEPETKESKQISEESNNQGGANDQLVIKLNSDMNDLAQLWVSYAKNKVVKDDEEDSEASTGDQLVLNGIVHECDRLLRKAYNLKENKDIVTKYDEETVNVDGKLYAIYGLALGELVYYQSLEETEEDDELKEFDEEKEKQLQKKRTDAISQFFDEALERIDTGLEKFPKDRIVLIWAKIQILVNRIPLQYISTMSMDSKKKDYPDISKLIRQVFDLYRNNAQYLSEIQEEKNVNDDNDYGVFFDYQKYLIMDALNDLLDMIENFGVNDDLDEIDSDNEDDIDNTNIELSKKHPLYEVRKEVPELEDRLIDICQQFLKHLKDVDESFNKIDLDKNAHDSQHKNNSLVIFYKEINNKLGELFLKKANVTGKIYTEVVYGDEDEEDKTPSLSKEDIKKLQEESIKNYKEAIFYIKKIEDPGDPRTWVDTAEAQISLGNIYDLESEEQEALYKKAEKKLRRANKATNGKFDHILTNLIEG